MTEQQKETPVLPIPEDEFTGVGGEYVFTADGKRVPLKPQTLNDEE